MKKLVKYETKGPNIAFWSIGLVFQYLERHVQWSSYYGFVFKIGVRYFFSEAKVSDFENIVFDHNVGRLEIPMYDTFPHKSKETITNLCKHVNTLIFVHLNSSLHDFGNVAVTKLLDYIVVFATFHDINKLHDIWIVNWLHDFYLLEKGAFEVLVRVD